MPSRQRDRARIERRLIKSLTQACETAKAEITGFDWLTHDVNDPAFESLRVVWVFDTRINRERALASGQDARMRELTAVALSDAGIASNRLEKCVRFDSEEECLAQHGGDWVARLARMHAAKG